MLAEVRARRRAGAGGTLGGSTPDAGCHMEVEELVRKKRAGGGLDSAGSSVMARISTNRITGEAPTEQDRLWRILALSPLAPVSMLPFP